MPRRTATVVIGEEGGRDKGKQFLLTEMPALKAERWAMRALNAAGRSNAQITPDMIALGMAGIAQFGLRSFVAMDFNEAEPLLNEMLDCVEFITEPSKGIRRKLFIGGAEDDLEEVKTIYRLRDEVFKLHTGFSLAAAALILAAGALPGLPSTGTNTSTSPEPSAS
jgi:hypothetical protein